MSGITCPNAIGCLIGLVARTTKIITKSVVDALKAGETVWDRKLTGFGVRCQSDPRKKTFVFKTRIGTVSVGSPLASMATHGRSIARKTR